MTSRLSNLVPQLREHLNDEQMVDAWGDGLPAWTGYVVKWHLAHCDLCRIRNANLEAKADRFFVEYQRAVELEGVQPAHDDTAEFLDRRRQFLATYVPQKRWSFRFPMMTLPELSSFNPMLATGVALIFAAAICLTVWNHQRSVKVSSDTFLSNAERWDTAQFRKTPGVVYQAVKITSDQRTVERTIYRDPTGRRRMKAVKASESDAHLRESLAVAGIDWDEPLSASDYQRWHDQQPVRQDEVTRIGKSLLRLTTVSAQGPVEVQSITVREMDFHPVQRSVQFRDSDTVEIAEVEFKVLPWRAVSANLFDDLSAPVNTASDVPSVGNVLPFRLPAVSTPAQLDETELSARLVLNQLHADTGEQIELKRDAREIVVRGLVDTDERKHQLELQLHTVPHLTVEIQSLTSLSSGAGSSRGTNIATKLDETTPELSPLESYLTKHGWTSSSITDLSRGLKRSALAISQESRAIGDLQSRFSSEQSHSLLASATLSELMFSHRQRLQEALAEERKLLGSALSSEVDATAWRGSPLPSLAEKNLALCNELTTSRDSASRDGQTILAELAASAAQLTADALHVEGAYRSDSTANGKK